MSWFYLLRSKWLVGLGIGFGMVLYGSSAIASETIILKYGPFRESIPVQELNTFAETGEQSENIKYYFQKSKQNPEAVRKALMQPVKANIIVLDRALNNKMGELALKQVSKFVHTRSGKEDQKALRASLIISASGDNQITLMEAINNYPTSEVEVEGEQVFAAYRRLQTLEGVAQRVMEKIKDRF